MKGFKEELAAVGDAFEDVQPVFIEFGANKKQVGSLGATEENIPMFMVLELGADIKYVKHNGKNGELKQFVEDYKVGGRLKGPGGGKLAIRNTRHIGWCMFRTYMHVSYIGLVHTTGRCTKTLTLDARLCDVVVLASS